MTHGSLAAGQGTNPSVWQTRVTFVELSVICCAFLDSAAFNHIYIY